MALPLTVLLLGPDGGEALVAEWYHPDGTTVRKGEAVLRLETDFAAIEVETECDGVLRHRAEAGTRQPSGGVVAVITAAGELLPGDAPPRPAPTEPPPPPKGRPRGDRRAALPLADVLRAAVEEVTASGDADVPEPLPWEAVPRTAPAGADETPAPAPMLLFPRIVSELKEQAELEAAAEPDLPTIEMADDPEPPTRMHAGAWDLVPGENDFNPEWITQRSDTEGNERRERFQAANIRGRALGQRTEPADDADEHTRADPQGVAGVVEPVPMTSSQAPAAVAGAPEPASIPLPLTVNRLVASPAANGRQLAPPARTLLELPSMDRRADYVPGASLCLRVTVDMGEAAKMRDQLTREWWGGNVRPMDEDIVLRAIARALAESSAFRRRTDVVGMRPLVGGSRTVHPLGDAGTRPFRDAVASLAALRETPGADLLCICTLTSFAELDLDDATPALPNGQPLAFAMGAVRDVARYRGDQPYRAQVMTLTLAYDSDATPDGAAARLLSRVRELVEAPYALLAD